MNRLILFLSCFLTATCSYGALTATNLLSLQPLSVGTNNTAAFSPTASLTVASQTFLIQNGGVDSTNSLVCNLQISFDNTNFSTIQVFRPATTNAGVEVFSPNISTNRVYLRIQVVTTNSVTAGVVTVRQQ